MESLSPPCFVRNSLRFLALSHSTSIHTLAPFSNFCWQTHNPVRDGVRSNLETLIQGGLDQIQVRDILLRKCNILQSLKELSLCIVLVLLFFSLSFSVTNNHTFTYLCFSQGFSTQTGPLSWYILELRAKKRRKMGDGWTHSRSDS